ncbi:MAG: LacI family DNA-binding transcriptional regulator [Methyloligellaceae bacterium]
MTTISDVAKKASVGLGTVSRVLSGKGSVSEETRKRVLKAMKDLNYRPNSVARSLATRRTNSIGLVVPEFQGRYFGRLIAAAQMEMRADEKHVIVANGSGKGEEEVAAIEFLRDRECDGLILYSIEMSDKEILDLLQNFPKTVLINRVIKGYTKNCFMLDHRYGGALAARCLLDAGHEKIACITGPKVKEDARLRQAGFESELKKAGIDKKKLVRIEGDFNYASGAICTEQLLKSGEKITALFCGNDEMAVGALFKLHEMGVRVPDDISLIGYDNAALSEHTYPKLTTISNPVEEITINASRFMRNLCYEQKNPVTNKFKPNLIVRETISSI